MSLERLHARLLTAGIDADIMSGKIVTDVTAKTKAEERDELNKAQREFTAKGKQVKKYGEKGHKSGLTGRPRIKNLGGKEAASLVTAKITIEKARGKVYVRYQTGKGKSKLLGSGNTEEQAITKAKHYLKVGNITTREFPNKVPSNALDNPHTFYRYKTRSSLTVTADRGITHWKRNVKHVGGKTPSKKEWEHKHTPDGKRPHGIGWQSHKMGNVSAAVPHYDAYVIDAAKNQTTCLHDNCDHKFPHREGSKGCHKHPEHKHFDSSAVMKPTAGWRTAPEKSNGARRGAITRMENPHRAQQKGRPPQQGDGQASRGFGQI